MSSEKIVTASGLVLFIWDSDDGEPHMLVNIEADDHWMPEAFELYGDALAAVADDLEEGVRIAIDYREEHHEVVDPEGATTHDSSRVRVVTARIEHD